MMTKERSPQSQRLDVMNELQSKMPQHQRQSHFSASPPSSSSTPVHHSAPQVQKSPSPKILINDTDPELHSLNGNQSNSSQHDKTPIFTVKKLPFLNDIKRLRQSEPHSPVATLTPPPGVVSDNLETSNISPHLGYLENRPKMTEFPFLDDIRKLRQNEHSSEQTNSISTTRSSEHQSRDREEYVEDDLLKYKQQRLDAGPTQSSSPPTKTVRFSTLTSPSPELITPPSSSVRQETTFNDTLHKQHETQDNEHHHKDYEEAAASSRTPRPKRSSRFNLKIDEKTNVKKLADQMIPQLNVMQKNFLGLLFFNELSQNIVDDIVAQQLSMMPGSKLASVLSGLDPQVH